ncbi:GCN5-related N-acetyltransferase [Desulfovibrio sp. X2]|uniref:GNAT family N-acetyltransferase n=1 Tax=Desulfovibrio sp. X2 TaxID=941449 RepID=UPI000358EF64|nr:GNAT family protein [Desulfovibrio sp. X2]EPR40878.1 GCN5-related N-acetyltransferase [Desulfovibrio sp. X2]
MRVREARLDDAGAMVELVRRVESATDWLLPEVEELTMDATAMTRRLGLFLGRENCTVIVAEDGDGGRLTGYLFALGGHLRGIAHAARINGLGVLPEARRRGVGLGMLRRLDAWAEERMLHRLELRLMAPNEAAHALYLRAGYLDEGLERHAYLVRGRYVDAMMMGKLLDGEEPQR